MVSTGTLIVPTLRHSFCKSCVELLPIFGLASEKHSHGKCGGSAQDDNDQEDSVDGYLLEPTKPQSSMYVGGTPERISGSSNFLERVYWSVSLVAQPLPMIVSQLTVLSITKRRMEFPPGNHVRNRMLIYFAWNVEVAARWKEMASQRWKSTLSYRLRRTSWHRR